MNVSQMLNSKLYNENDENISLSQTVGLVHVYCVVLFQLQTTLTKVKSTALRTRPLPFRSKEDFYQIA